MKFKGLVFLTAVMALMLGSCAKNAIKGTKILTAEDSLAYAFGIVNYNALTADSLNLNPLAVAKAMLDGKSGKPLLSDEIARSVIMKYINKREAEKAAKKAATDKILYKDYIEQNVAFLSKNKERKEVIVTPSGLQYEVMKMGNGPKPTAQSTVKVNYVGTLIDGTEFDSSVKRKQPAQFPVAGIIPGWKEALQLMPVGSKFKLYLPQELAYGANQAGDKIKPYSTLIFEVELLEIVK
ncbi:MAG: FKBP-type peptidyl-prolyl cis-trans isomerase [Bacteroidales bacterium]|jgi:FKBP-type peptidyl-prolyl cis-trans isomerase FklB